VVIAAVTTTVIILARKKQPSPPSGCVPPCPSGFNCDNNQCVSTTGCTGDRDCDNHEVCANPGTPGSFCTACRKDIDCEWDPDNQYCSNGSTRSSKCVQCVNSIECNDTNKYVCIDNKCISGCSPGYPLGGNYILQTTYNGEVQYVTISPKYKFFIASSDKSKATVFTWACDGITSTQGNLTVGTYPVGYYGDNGPNSPCIPPGAEGTFHRTEWNLLKQKDGSYYIQIAGSGSMYCWYYCLSGNKWTCGDRVMCNSSCSNPPDPATTKNWEFIPVH